MKFTWIAGVVLAGLFHAPTAEAADPGASIKSATVEEFDRMRTNKNTVLLDVRTKKEFDSGHLPGAVNIDWNGADFAKEAAKLDPARMYLVHCAVGRRSASACEVMRGKLGLTNCVNLEGGLRDWQKSGRALGR